MWFVLNSKQTTLTFHVIVYNGLLACEGISKTIKSFVNDAFSPSFYIYFIEYNMIVKQVFSTSRLQSHKFILANIEQTWDGE